MSLYMKIDIRIWHEKWVCQFDYIGSGKWFYHVLDQLWICKHENLEL